MGQQEKSSPNSNPMQRVKVYCMSDDGKWDDRGTGHAAVDYLERSEDLGLFVYDAEENQILLMHHIRAEDIYRRQEDSIIAWKDPDYATELALSFQEPAGCTYIWEHISSVQRNLQFAAISSDTFQSVNSELRELPAADLAGLPLLHKMVVESGIADHMRLTELFLHDQDFFGKLMELFTICEDSKNLEGLHMIYRIVKGIILLNSPQIFEKIFGDELIMNIIGSLEYDPEVSQVQHHRNFLKEHVAFKEAIPIKDSIVLSKIHQTYRVGYLKDVILARVLDDATIANLNSIIHSNNAKVVSSLQGDIKFMLELLARLRSSMAPSYSKKNLIYFLHDFCNLSKSLQMGQQLRLFRDLMDEGIFDILKEVLQSHDNRLVLTGTDILILFINQDPNLLRSYVVQPEGSPLLALLVKGMITDFGDDMHCQFLEILRSLLDSDTLSGGQRDSIIEIFYEKHLGLLIDVIGSSCPPRSPPSSSSRSDGPSRVKNPNRTKPEILSSICELLCFCVVHHAYRARCNLLLNNILDKVLLLLHRREKYLGVAAVRFIRTVLSRRDEHLINHIIRNNLLKPIVDAFVKNGDHYNLLNSAVLELFEYIRKENLKSLVRYIVNSFWKDLMKFEDLASIQALKVMFEQSQDNSGLKSTANVLDPRKWIDECALEKEEEECFNYDSDEDTASDSMSHPQNSQPQPVGSNGVSPSPQSRSKGLVDYDDDEDYRPPPRKQPDSVYEEGAIESLKLKKKPTRGKEPELRKKQRLNESPKLKDGVFAALCSTLSQAVLPGKKSLNSTTNPGSSGEGDSVKSSSENVLIEKAAANSWGSPNHGSLEEEIINQEKEIASPRSCSDSLQGPSSDNTRQLGGEEIPLVPPKSSAEMAVNGS